MTICQLRAGWVTGLVLLAATGLSGCSKLGGDPFSGVYESESRANFGTSVPGNIRIEVTREGDTYRLDYSGRGKKGFSAAATACEVSRKFRHPDLKHVYQAALCSQQGMPTLVYSPQGLPEPFRRRIFSGKYYAHVQMGFYGFRKIK